MTEINAVGNSLAQAYNRALAYLYESGEFSECMDWNCDQLEAGMTMVVLEPLNEPMISKFFIGGPTELQQYVMEMLDGILDFEVGRGKWAYTYHLRMVEPINQIDFVLRELHRNPSSRRAVILIRDNVHDVDSEDPACLQHLQYFIRNGKLDCVATFRSNDACKATFMNAFALIMLQKKIADELGVGVGTYTHRANSFHCYDKDWPTLAGYVSKIKNCKLEELSYNYAGDWDELMSDAIPEIEDKVKELRDRE